MQPLDTLWDKPLDRRGTSATKWEKYGPEVLPFWVADMDLATPGFVRDAVAERLAHPVLGYTNVPGPLVDAFIDWMQRRYQWRIDPDWLIWLPGVVAGMNVSARALTQPGDPVFVMPPVYYPFLDIAANAGARRVDVPLQEPGWHMDLDALADQAAREQQASARLLLLCNPQNPTGRAYSRAELTALAQLCEREDILICSDEIHADLLLERNAVHTPIASLAPEIAARTITLIAPTKTYNMPGLGCAVAIVPDAGLRERIRAARQGLVAGATVLGYAAATAAYAHDGSWVAALCEHLRGNYQRLAAVAGARLTPLQATYLGWIDLRDFESARGEDPHAYLLRHGLGLSNGADFGAPGFVRFNFACPRSQLETGLTRLQNALAPI